MEVWRDIPGLPGYQASSQGRVRSLAREVLRSDGRTEHRRECIISQCMGSRGYMLVSFWTRIDGKRRRVSQLTHRIVAAAFLGPCPDGLEVNHANGVKTDNRLENLEYVTRSENERHARRTGLKQSHKGERNSAVKLTQEAVLLCRQLAGSVPQRILAERFGVSQSAISLAVSGANWASAGVEQ